MSEMDRDELDVPRHMVGSATPVTLDWRQGGSVQRASGRRRTGRKGTTSAIRAGAREVSEPATILDREACLGRAGLELLNGLRTHIALLSGVLQPQAGAFSLDVAYSPARITLLSSD